MKNHQKQHFHEFYLMLSDGSSIKTSRRECFAPAESVTPDNLFRQRWLYSPDGQIAIRLPRNELGETLGKDNANELKTEERITERKTLCVGQTSHASCSKTCEDCPFGEYCDSGYRSNNGIDCKRKCDCCSSYVRRTIELDKSYPDKDENDTYIELEDETANVGAIVEEKAILTALLAVLDKLTPDDRELWDFLINKEKKQVVADRFNLTLYGVRYREQRLFKIMRSNTPLKNFFEKD